MTRHGILFAVLCAAILGGCREAGKSGVALRLDEGGKLERRALSFPDGTTIQAEVAETPGSREMGLMFRTRLDPDYGMLFIFPQSQPQMFWMKNTFVDLDMIFLDEEKRVTVVHHDVPRSSPGQSDETVARRAGVGRYVLELPSGSARKLGLKVGDTLRF